MASYVLPCGTLAQEGHWHNWDLIVECEGRRCIFSYMFLLTAPFYSTYVMTLDV